MPVADAKSVTTAQAAAAPGKKDQQSLFGAAIGLLAGVVSMTCLVALWAAGIGLPFVLAAAAATGRWRLAKGLAALFLAPQVLSPLPRLPLVADFMSFGFERWLGPPGSLRFVDLSAEATRSEPEPEPSPAGKASQGKPQLFLMHPHGIYSLGVISLAINRPDVRVLSSPFLYHLAPVFRFATELMFGFKLGSVAKKDLARLMKRRDSPMMMVPGGFHEATISCPGHDRVYLKRRMGFVKYALRYGYDLVPCYTVGESDLFANPQGAWKLRFFLNAMSIPAVLPWGFLLLPFFPRRGISLVTVVGPPMDMPQIKNPTSAEVKEHHARYVSAVRDLYKRAVPGTASEKRKLEVW